MNSLRLLTKSTVSFGFGFCFLFEGFVQSTRQAGVGVGVGGGGRRTHSEINLLEPARSHIYQLINNIFISFLARL